MEIFSNFQLAILITTLIANILLAFFVYINNPKSATNIIFSLLSLVTTTWLIIMYLSFQPASLSTALFWIRLSIFLAVPQAVFFFLLAHTLPKEKLQLSRRFLLTIAAWSIFIMGLTISPYVFTDIEIVNNSPRPIPGFGLPLFALTTMLFSFGAIYILIKRLRRSAGVEKLQLRFVMFGILLMLGLIIGTIMIPVAIFRNSNFVPFAPLYTLAFLGMTTYAIIKHRLLDIRLVVARAVAYTFLVVVFATAYVGATFISTSFFLSDPASRSQLVIYSLLTLILAFSFQPLRRIFEKVTDRIFFKNRYDSSELLSELTKIMATTLELRKITEKTLRKMLPEMRISKGAFVLIERGKVETVESIGFDKKQEFVGIDILSLLEKKKVLFYEEEHQKGIKKIMRELDATVSVPLEVKEGELGVLLLGHKLSGEIYTDQDIKLLEILSPEISIAIQNSKAYEEIRRFSITLQKEVERATSDLRHANDRLKELDELKDEFMSIASHELRTPMTAIKSYIWLALHGKTQEKDPKVRTYLDKVFESSDRMIAMINDMLNVSRIETGRLQLDIVPISVWKVAEQVKDDLSARAAEAGIDIIINKEGIAPPVLADKDKLAEMFTNLIGNALKFTKKGGKVIVAAGKVGGMVEVSVTDTGVGIAKENIGKLFKKYGKLSESYATMSPTTGTGLGLYITKQYAEKMRGSISVKSILGKGTTFTFSLPIATGKDLDKREEKEEQPTGVILNPKLAKTFDISNRVVKTEIGRTLSAKK